MSWHPMEKLSEIMQAEADNASVYWWPEAGSYDVEPVEMQRGKRYEIELDYMRIEAEVCRINYGAESSLQLMYLSRCGSTLLNWFSPNDMRLVREL